MPTLRARAGAAWKRVPAIVRRGAVVYAAVRAYQYAQVTDTLYKLSAPSRSALGATVLDLDLAEVALVAHDGRRSGSPLAAAEQLGVARAAATLRAARDDPRVAGLVCRGLAGLSGVGLADLAELRRAVRQFSEGPGGKPSLLHVPEGLGLAGNGTVPLYFASAFDSTHVMPTSAMLVPGLSFASMFFKGTMEKLGVTPIKVARKEYKTAANTFTEDAYTDPHRESTEALLDSVMHVVTSGIAEGRGMTGEKVRDVFDVAIMSAPEAVELDIIDGCAYRDELPKLFRERLRDGVRARRAQRVGAEREWRAAMGALADAWTGDGDGGGELARWRDGANIAAIDSLLTAMRFAASFGAVMEGNARAGRVLRAELRALKAHLAWLDTRPWEGVARKDRAEFDILFGMGHASSVVELERRLCAEAINALEEFPGDFAALAAKAKQNDGRVETKDVKQVIRWTRAMWRAKTLAARMVGSMTASPDPKDDSVAAVVDDTGDAKRVADAKLEESDGPCAPRLFLMHQDGDPKMSCISEELDGKVCVDYCEPGKVDGSFKDRLRYQAFNDYVQLLASEEQAGMQRSGSSRRGLSQEQLMTIEGMPDDTYLGGVVDLSERAQLVALADHTTPVLTPWRLESRRRAPTIAVINVDGAISDNTSEEVRASIRRATKDPRVQGIVMRIDSPGGSASASDLISRAVEVCNSKPIVASMANVCASGGLFIAVPCDKIFAEEATITGSCGVIFSGFLPMGLFERLGITVDSVESSKFSKYFGGAASVTDWSHEYRKAIDRLIDGMYSGFVSAVSRGRGMSVDEVEAIARGRVWSGIDALRLGLIDEHGGLQDAAACAAEMAGGEPGIAPRTVNYPTMGMKLEDQLRRVGVIRSQKDEEGDEQAPSRKKKKMRRSVTSMILGGDDDVDDEDGGDAEDEEDDKEDKPDTKAKEKSDEGAMFDFRTDDDIEADGDEDASTASKLRLKVNAPDAGSALDGRLTPGAAFALLRDSPRALLGAVAEGLQEAQDEAVSSCALWCLRQMDGYLTHASPTSPLSAAANYMLGAVLARAGIADAVAAEMQAAAATAGRPAMVMSPQVHAMHGPGSPVNES